MHSIHLVHVLLLLTSSGFQVAADASEKYRCSHCDRIDAYHMVKGVDIYIYKPAQKRKLRFEDNSANVVPRFHVQDR